MKNQKGITLITLILTVIIIILIASIGVYTGVEAYKTMKIQKFIAQMRVVQERINVICEDWKNWEEYNPDHSEDPTNLDRYIVNKLKNNGAEPKKANEFDQSEFKTIISGDETKLKENDKNIKNYYYFSPEDLEYFLGLRDLDIEVIINFSTRNFVEKKGVESLDTDGNIKRYYVLDELIDAQRLTETIIQNENTINIEEMSEYYKYLETSIISNNGTSKTLYISLNVKVVTPLKSVEYSTDLATRVEDIINWTAVSDYEADNSGIKVKLDKNGNYYFKVTDAHDNVFYTKNYVNIELVNAPVLEIGMRPICFENGKIVEIDSTDTRWYDYSYAEKKWANVMLKDGSIYVWIPRFAYKINTDNIIEIQFLYETGNQIAGTKPLETLGNDYQIHPAFCEKSITNASSNYKNGEWDKKITGIWVSKFNANVIKENDESIVTTAYGKKMSKINSVEDAMKLCREIETKNIYGFTNLAEGTLRDNLSFETDNNYIDTHLIKNSEMGAIIYLTYSKYGNKDVKDNSSEDAYAGGSNIENDIFNSKVYASTTGNATGIYDLLTNVGEYVAAGVLDTSGGDTLSSNSSKYFTIYSSNEGKDVVGDGIYEIDKMTSWILKERNNSYPDVGNPIFVRGRNIKDIFSYSKAKIEETDGYYFRPVIIAEK